MWGCSGSFPSIPSVRLAGAAWVQWPRSHVWWYVLAVSWAFPCTCLSSSRRLLRASLHDSEEGRAYLVLEVAEHPFCRTLLVRARLRPTRIQGVGKNSKTKLPCSVAPGGSLGTMNITIHSRVERDIVNACVHTLSASPLNSSIQGAYLPLYSQLQPS